MDRLFNLLRSPLLPILQHVSEAILVVAPGSWRVVYANPAVGSCLDSGSDEACGESLEELLKGDERRKLMERLECFWRSQDEQLALSTHLFIHGRARPVFLQACRIVLDEQPLLGIVLRRDDNARFDAASMESERRDPLTGLPDRAFLLSRLAVLLRGERTADRQCAVLFVDLDNFKQVNDAQGHLIGDRVLREVARRLTHCVREGDYVARFGGDEFVVLVERVGAYAEVEAIIRRIHAVLAKPIALPDGEVTLSVSIGAAEASPEHQTPEDILAAADRAMYASKRSNG